MFLAPRGLSIHLEFPLPLEDVKRLLEVSVYMPRWRFTAADREHHRSIGTVRILA